MRKNPNSQSGLFDPRVLLAFTLCSVGVFLAALGFAAMPTPPGWSLITSPNTSATQTNYLNGVTCASASDCWAVGYYNAGSASTHLNQTLIERWNGTSWSIVTSPNTSATQNNYLNGVTCASGAACWAIGFYYNGSVNQTLTEHWDGTSWAIVPSNNNGTLSNVLSSVTCAQTSECWAVGTFETLVQTTVFPQTLTEKWNGSAWIIVTSPDVTQPPPTRATQPNYLYGVACPSATDCWAVGKFYDTNNGAHQTLIEHWNGTAWVIVSSQNTSSTQDNILSGVTCASASECWAIGNYYNSSKVPQTLIEQWNGSWAIVTSPNNGTQNNDLNGVTCASTSECWAVGYYGSVYQTLIERWDGTSWGTAPVTSPDTSATQNNLLNSVMCASASECWAVGYYYNGTVAQTLIEEYSLTIPPLTGVVSRMTHGSAGTFDINLPLIGTRGVECRTSASLGAGNYAVVFTFANNVTNCGTAGTTGGSVSPGPNANQCTVNLTGVPNAQYITVTLTGVLDSKNNTGNVSATMGVLIGTSTLMEC